MKKNVLAFVLCLIMSLALLPAFAFAEDAEACWGAVYGEENMVGSGTLQQALDAAAADSSVSYIWLKKDLTNAEYTISGGCFTFDQDYHTVSAAAGKSAFAVTGQAEVHFLLYGTLYGGSSCVRICSDDAWVTLDSSSVFSAAPGMPAVELEAGTVAVYRGTFAGEDRSCDILYKGGVLDLREGFSPVSVTNASGSAVTANATEGSAILLNEMSTLNVNGAPVSQLASGATGVRSGSVTVRFDANGGSGSMADMTLDTSLFDIPECGFTAPGGKVFERWTIILDSGEEESYWHPGEQCYVTEDITLRAEWREKTVIHFDANGGTGVMEDVTLEGDIFGIPECGFTAPKGKIFRSWTCIYEDGSEQTSFDPGFTVSIKEPVTFRAEWIEQPLIRFDANGGTGSMADVIPEDSEYRLPACRFTAPEGKMFVGWQIIGGDPEMENTVWNAGQFIELEGGSITLRAKWVNKPVVHFDANGGSGMMTDLILSDISFIVPECSFSVPEGRVFSHWTLLGEGELNETTWDAGETVELTQSITLRAEWTDAPVVRFEANGGGGTMANIILTEDRLMIPECQFTAPAGKMFKGWTLVHADGTESQYYYAGNWKKIRENVTLRAEWLAFPKVRFDANGGSGVMADMVLESNQMIIPQCGFTAPAGKIFGHWIVLDEEEAVYYEPGDMAFLTEEEITLTAMWISKSVVRFDANGGLGSMADVILEKATFEIPECAFTPPAGKIFDCWTIIYADGYEGAHWYSGEYTTIAENVTLRAEWVELPHISFMANGGTGVMADMFPESIAFTIPKCAFTAPDGKLFAYWTNIDSYGNEDYPYYEGMSLNRSGRQILRAEWIERPVIHFDPNGGTGAMADLTLDGVMFELPECGFTPPAGKVFAYWTLIEADGSQIEAAYPEEQLTVMGSAVLRAVWMSRPTVRFDPNGGTGVMQPVTLTDSLYTVPECGFTAPEGKVFTCWKICDASGRALNIGYPGQRVIIDEDRVFYAVWQVPQVRINVNYRLLSGQYLSNIGVVSSSRPSGGYAYLKDGVLTLHDFEGISIESDLADLTIVLEGTSKLNNEPIAHALYGVVNAYGGSLTIQGSGALQLTGTYDADAICVEHGDVIITDGRIDIVSDDDGIDVENGNLSIRGGQITIRSKDHGIDVDCLEVPGTGKAVVSGGTLNVVAGDDGFDCDSLVAITGGTLNLQAVDNGIDCTDDIAIHGGTISVFAGEHGIQGETVEIGKTALGVMTKDGNGLAVFAYNSLRVQDPRFTVVTGLSLYGENGFVLADASGTVLHYFTPSNEGIADSVEGQPPQTGDSTPAALLAALMALSACGITTLRKKRA